MSANHESIRVIVVDDEPLARDELVFLLRECGGIEVLAECASASEALRAFETHTPDALFVDLRMPGPDGLSLAEAVAKRAPHTPVVVVSAHDEGALRGFEVGVVDYVLKPPRLDRLKRAIERVREKLSAHDKRTSPRGDAASSERPSEGMLTRLAVRRKNAFVVVDLDDVIFLEMKDELVWAVTREDRFALDLTLSALEGRLPEVFFRSHRGAIVRVDRIVAIEPAGAGTFDLVMDHPAKLKVPLARERARILRERIPIAG